MIVNTVARDMNLSYGRVSSSLLQAAGQDLQKECRKQFSCGISPDEIAVTDGYALNCKKLFHVTLQRRDKSSKGHIQVDRYKL